MSSRTPIARMAKRRVRAATTIAVIIQSMPSSKAKGPRSKVQSFLRDFGPWTLDFGLLKSEGFFDANRVYFVADGYLADDVHALGHLAEVGVLGIQEARVSFDDEELAVAVEWLVSSASHAQRTCLEGDDVVLSVHLAAAAAVTGR